MKRDGYGERERESQWGRMEETERESERETERDALGDRNSGDIMALLQEQISVQSVVGSRVVCCSVMQK